ncbi:MAG: glycogen debranching protein GlgX [Saprospiraceae bacterium]|nr:glycogen debranching protein GlgX [Saprospiraceae bacterium]
MLKTVIIQSGESYPLGATVTEKGVNFCLFSKNAQQVELLLFDEKDQLQPTHQLKLDPELNKTFYYWHCFIPGLKAGQRYAYRVFGPDDPSQGLRFDGEKVLIDPYARAVEMGLYDRGAAVLPGDNCHKSIRSVAIDPKQYDWEDDRPLNHPFAKSVIYELHVAGFTKSPSSRVAKDIRGTYRGLIEKIPYLKDLGVTSVELMPCHQFDPTDAPSGLNYWGYSPIAFFAPHTAYAAADDPEEVLNEFRDMVKAFHKAGIEVILDVVFNHTGEGNERGPILSHKGIENRAYYMLESNDPQYYSDYTGTGNTLNANHSVVRRMIIDCLCHWVREMHIDGFRFDLASVLSRDENGHFLENPPLLWEIESEPQLASTKIIAEAWDIRGYQLGSFIGDKWAEWNGVFRDDIRKFAKGDTAMIPPLADRLVGSPNLFGSILRDPNRSINFVTCHDGFTMYDLVSYNHKRNEANGENNRDGSNNNNSWNSGVEGPTDDPAIQALRHRQIKNFMTILMISQGTPMLSMGDEIKRTQGGNNNAYCQDNEISWMNWKGVKAEKHLLAFVKKLIKFNLSSPFFQENIYWTNPGGIVITWHGTKLFQPNWSEHSHSLAYQLYHPDNEEYLYIALNAYWDELEFELPKLPAEANKGKWKRIVDTSLTPPEDCRIDGKGKYWTEDTYRLPARSILVLAN